MILKLLLFIFLVILSLSIGIFIIFFLTVFISKKEKSIKKSETYENVQDINQPFQEKLNTKKSAIILCDRILASKNPTFITSGFTDCKVLDSFYNGNSPCKQGCLGLGSCVRICPSDAIIIRNDTITITNRCTGCGICVSICPKNIIKLVEKQEKQTYYCVADKLSQQKKYCITAANDYKIQREGSFKN